MFLTRFRPLRWVRHVRRSLYRRVPAWYRRNDFQIFAAVLCLFAGLPLLLTTHVDAASIDATLPYGLVKIWSLILAGAPVCILFGLIKAFRRPMSEATFWLRVEAYGLRALAYASYIYAFCIYLANGLTTLPAVAIVLCFALTCHSRATDIVIRVEDFLDHLGVDR